MYAIGLMSGTSLDGIDVCLCEIIGVDADTKIKLIDFMTCPIDEKLKTKIRKACFKESSSVDLICSLNFEIGKAFSDAVSAILEKSGFKDEDIDFIASHGQTIYHQPIADDNHVSSTLQIGEASVIAYEHQTMVISDFRVMDMAAGGQGAPLVPYSEYVLYSQKDKHIGLLNLGGIGNITYLDGHLENMIAFDTGPANMMINEAMKCLYQLPYDKDGEIAFSGKLIPELIDTLKNDEYILLDPPKSTGREHFGEDVVKAILEKYKAYPKEDIIHTLTYFTSFCVTYHIKKYLPPLDRLIVGGGGAHNLAIMKMLKDDLAGVEVLSQEDLGFVSDAKEAMAFVILGNQTYHHRPANVPSATGAKKSVILGKITMMEDF